MKSVLAPEPRLVPPDFLAVPLRSLLVAALLIPFSFTSSSATPIIALSADYNNIEHPTDPAAADNFGDEVLPETSAHGIAAANDLGVGAFVSPGPMPSCGAPSIGFSCATAGPGARASGEVRGDLGLERAVASATTHVVFDGTGSVVSGVGHSLAGVSVSMQAGFVTGSLGGPVTFDLHVSGKVVESGPPDIIDSDRLDITFSLLGLAVASFPGFEFHLPDHSPGPFVLDKTFVVDVPANSGFAMELQMFAEAECGVNALEFGGASCSVLVDAGDTAYLGVEGDVVSTTNGYSFPGFQPPAVPEPATIAMFGLGLVGLGFIQRRRRGAESYPAGGPGRRSGSGLGFPSRPGERRTRSASRS
jgi:hypothetical protein